MPRTICKAHRWSNWAKLDSDWILGLLVLAWAPSLGAVLARDSAHQGRDQNLF